MTLLTGDCIEQMRTLEANSVDAIVTDPPYGLEFMGKDWDAPWKGKASREFNDVEPGTLGGFTKLPNHTRVNNVKCQTCDKWKFSSNPCICESPTFPNARLYAASAFQTWSEQWAREALRVLKPGGHLLAFGGTRMYHRLAAGIEDAGFEIRDTLMWLYGSGFPKSHNLKEEWEGWGTALKPAVEPIVLARKPLIGTVAENVLTHGTGALNIDASRIGTEQVSVHNAPKGTFAGGEEGRGSDTTTYRTHTGRWPANILLDEEAAALLDEQSGGASRFFYVAKASRSERNAGLDGLPEVSAEVMSEREAGSAGLIRMRADGSMGENPYAGKTANAKNIHPTVKPVALMKYLIRLVTPKGGVVLDPFLGSGTTAVAAIEEGVEWIGCEREAEYVEIIKARVAAAQPGLGLTLDGPQD